MLKEKLLIPNYRLIIHTISLLIISVSVGQFLLLLIYPNVVIRQVHYFFSTSNTLICFILTGICLALLENKSKKSSFINYFSVSMIFLINILALYDYYAMDLNLNLIILKTIGVKEMPTIFMEMTLITNLTFILVIISLLLARSKKINIWIFQSIVWLIFTLSLFSFCNFLFNPNTNVIIQATTMSLTTTTLFTLVGVGLLLARSTEGIMSILLSSTANGYILWLLIACAVVLHLTIIYLELIVFPYMPVTSSHLGNSIDATAFFVAFSIMIALITFLMEREKKQVSKVENVLRKKEFEFDTILKNSDVIFFRTSNNFDKLYFISESFGKIFDLSTAELYKNPKLWLDLVVSQDKRRILDCIFNTINIENTVEIDFKIKRRDNHLRYLHAKIFQLRDENRFPVGKIGMAIDMTETIQNRIRNKAETEVIEVFELYNNIQEISVKLLNVILKLYDFKIGEIWLIDPERKILRCIHSVFSSDKKIKKFCSISKNYNFKQGEGFPGQIWEYKKINWLENYPLTNFHRAKEALTAGLCSALGIPILFHDNIYGVFEFFSDTKNKPNDDILNFISHIGNLLGQFINHKYSEEQITHLSKRDLLTGLFNRSAFEEKLNEYLREENPSLSAVFIVKINQFRLINESLGFAKGNEILMLVAHKLAALVEKKTCYLARIGADKFIIHESNFKSLEEIANFAKIVEAAFLEPVQIELIELPLNIQIGVSIYPRDGNNASELIQNANLAFTYSEYSAEKNIYFYEKKMTEDMQEEFFLIKDLPQALAKHQLVIYFQPLIDLRLGNICGAEALIRWHHPEKGLLLPKTIKPHIEKDQDPT